MKAAMLDPDACARLAEDARADNARMTRAPWIVETDVLYSDSKEEGTIQLAEFSGEAMVDDDAAVARQRNNLAEAAEQLTAAALVGGIVRRMHETSERADDVRSSPMRLVRQEVFDELMALMGGGR